MQVNVTCNKISRLLSPHKFARGQAIIYKLTNAQSNVWTFEQIKKNYIQQEVVPAKTSMSNHRENFVRKFTAVGYIRQLQATQQKNAA